MVFDILFLILIGWAAYKGFTKGFILQAASLGALILGIYGAIKFSGYFSAFLKDKTNLTGDYFPVISFAIIFIAIVIIIHFIARMLEKMADLVALSFLNKIFGAIFSIIKYALIISVILVILKNLDRRTPFLPKNQIQKSIFFTPVYVLAPFIYPYLRYNFFPNDKKYHNSANEIPV